MKRLVLAALLVCGLAAPASAFTLWQGEVFVTKATPACLSPGWPVGSYATVVLRPIGLPGNEGSDGSKFTAFAVFGSRSEQRYSIRNKGFVTGVYSGQAVFSSAGYSAWDGTGGTLQSKLTVKVTPATIKASTPSLDVIVTITNFDDASGCTVTLQGGLFKRP